MKGIFGKKEAGEKHYENSTQSWLPIETIINGIVVLKDGRFIKILEVLPVNFYLKSAVEQENIIFYFASYLKIAPDNVQVCVKTERADIGSYIRRHEAFSQNEQNKATIEMIYDEMNFVRTLSENVAVKKRFYIIFEYVPRAFSNSSFKFDDVIRQLFDEAYKAQRYLSQCELSVLDITDDGQLIDLFYSFINKQSSKYVNPGNFVRGMFDEIHTFEGGKNGDEIGYE